MAHSLHAPSVSVVIPTRNRFDFLTEAIASVRAQTLTNWEVVVVDDASDDGSAERLDKWLRDDARIHLVALRERCERSTARNTGLAEAAGRYVLFLDDDDRLVPNALERLVATLDGDSDAVVAIGARRFFDAHAHTRRAPHPRFRIKKTLTVELLLGWMTAWVAVPGQCLIRTEVLRNAGGWNTTLVGPEDQELLLRLTARTPAVLVPSVVLEYRLHATQWRPADVSEQEDAFRGDAAVRLAKTGNRRAMKLLEAGRILREAGHDYNRWEYGHALRKLIAAGSAAPVILTSPIIGPPYVHLCVKSSIGALSGKIGAKAIRDVRERIRQIFRRSPEARVSVLRETETVPGRAKGYQTTTTSASRPRVD